MALVIPRKPDFCELCGREVGALTKHHLIPRSRHRNKRLRRHYGRTELLTRVLWVCRPCHKHVHAVCTEKELEGFYNTREALLAHPEVRRFVEWIKDKPEGFAPRSRGMKRRSS